MVDPGKLRRKIFYRYHEIIVMEVIKFDLRTFPVK